MTDTDSVEALIEGGENQKTEFKQSQILQDSKKIAKVITGMANAEGGYLLIGVNDDSTLEQLQYDKNVEEKIMNICIDLCQPRINVTFSHSEIDDSTVYKIKIPKKDRIPYAVKNKNEGLSYYIRHGTTTRPLPFNEFERLFIMNAESETEGVEVPFNRSSLYDLGKFILKILHLENNTDFTKIKKILLGIGTISLVSVLAPILIYYFTKNLDYLNLISENPYVFATIFVVMTFSFSFLKIMAFSRCPECKRYFTYRLVNKWVFNKRNIDENNEEWTVRTLKECEKCQHSEYSRPFYETHRIEEYFN
ncbi:MAG: AlbA family DNA-binding domain-containing protein [Candidatus Odinarchaeia archaeon]